MSVLTLEIPDKLFENLQARAFKANTTVEKMAVSALSEKAYLDKLREEGQEGIDALRNGNFKEYNSADELMDDIIARGNERLAQRNTGAAQK